MLRINEKLAAEIRAHGARTYPQECCGALLGRDNGEDREVLELIATDNARADSAHNRYLVRAEDVLRAELAARNSGLDVLGWYHSHPDHPALPSEFDRAHAWPWYSYVIVTVERGQPGTLLSWRLSEDRARFRAEDLKICAATAAENPTLEETCP